LLRGDREQSGALSNIGIDPQADAQPAFVESTQQAGGSESSRVPLEIAPFKLSHPKAIKVENVQRKVADFMPSIKLVTVFSS